VKRSGLVYGYWFDLRGKKLRRVRRAELAGAYRLRSKHADVLRGQVKA
jgi:hypothetical protein